MAEETTVTNIDLAYPEVTDLHLVISVGACRLTIRPGEGDGWATGGFQAPASVPPPLVVREGGTARITQQHSPASLFGLLSGLPKLDLALGKARPYMLTLKVGASEASFDLGGLPLTRLAAELGAGKVDFDFSAPNPGAMGLLDLDAGAVRLGMRNLAHAGFSEMAVDAGATSLELDFGGALQRDAHVRINSGASSVKLRVPATTAAKITADPVLGGLDLGDGWTKKEGAFWTEAALAGETPVLTVRASVSLGALRIEVG